MKRKKKRRKPDTNACLLCLCHLSIHPRALSLHAARILAPFIHERLAEFSLLHCPTHASPFAFLHLGPRAASNLLFFIIKLAEKPKEHAPHKLRIRRRPQSQRPPWRCGRCPQRRPPFSEFFPEVMKGVVVLSSQSATVKDVAETLTEFLEKVHSFSCSLVLVRGEEHDDHFVGLADTSSRMSTMCWCVKWS